MTYKLRQESHLLCLYRLLYKRTEMSQMLTTISLPQVLLPFYPILFYNLVYSVTLSMCHQTESEKERKTDLFIFYTSLL